MKCSEQLTLIQEKVCLLKQCFSRAFPLPLRARVRGLRAPIFAAAGLLLAPYFIHGQEAPPGAARQGPTQLELKKTAKTRQYQGRSVEGEERVVRPGETLWDILIQEKGLAEKRFGQYQSLVEGLNPQLKELNTLRIGETIFIPFRLDELLGVEVSTQGDIRVYRVKPGDFVYKILRREFALENKDELLAAFEKLKELNPTKKNWNLLVVGEALRFPTQPGSQPSVAKARESAEVSASAPVAEPQALAENRWAVLEQVAGALGNTVVRTGEEVFELQNGRIVLDRALFPVVHNPQLGRKVVLDTRGAMPAGLKARIEAESADTSIVSVRKESGPGEMSSRILAQLGYQALPNNRPLVLHDMGIGIQLRGDWMIVQPESAGAGEQIWVFLLTSAPEKVPDSLGKYLSSKGVKLAQVFVPAAVNSPRPVPLGRNFAWINETENLPKERTGLVDTLLQTCQIAFGRDQDLSIALREGIHLRMKVDRYWESGGKKSGFLFGKLSGDMKKAVEESAGLKLIEIDIKSLSTREIVARVLQGLGESATYAENRFAGSENGRLKESIVLSVRGFLVRNRSLLVTDRVIPSEVERFILNQGIKIAYFQ